MLSLQEIQTYYQERLENKVSEVLCRGDLYKFYLMRQPKSHIRADFLLYWKDDEDNLYHNLFLSKERSLLPERQNGNGYSALSYVVLTDKDDYDMYIRQQEYKEIVAFEIVDASKQQLKNDLKDVRSGRNLSHPYDNTKQLFDDLEI